jgi:hypothetical protein
MERSIRCSITGKYGSKDVRIGGYRADPTGILLGAPLGASLGISLGAPDGAVEGTALGADDDVGVRLGCTELVGSALPVGTELGPLDG